MFPEILTQFTSATNILLGVIFALLLIALSTKLLSQINVPGPWGIPIFGYYPFLKKDYHLQLQKFSKKYGEVYRINIAGQDYLYLGTIKALREAHVNQSNNFYDRSNKHVMFDVAFEHGLLAISGEPWRQMRKFFTQCLRDVGIGANKEELKGPVEDGMESTLKALKKTDGNVVELLRLMTQECTKPVLKLYLGDLVTDEVAMALNEAYINVADAMTTVNIMLSGPIGRKVVFPWIKGYPEMVEGLKEMKKLLNVIIDEHKKNFNSELPPGDFIDRFMLEKSTREKKCDTSAKYFTDDCLMGTLIQAYGDGSTGVGVFVAYFLKNLTYFRKVQDDIYEEIVRVVGTERLPTLADREQIPLLNSTISELFRTSHYFPIIPSLECANDTTVLGVKTPKGCITMVNYFAAHHDPDVYENPNEFDATRFLPGKKVEHPITFGLGKRFCAGERLVMAELFLFMAAVLQNFILLSPIEDETFEHRLQQLNEVFDVRAIPRPGGRFSSST